MAFSFNTAMAADLMLLMSHEGRLRVLSMIVEKDWDVGSLADAINISQSALSQHLKKMRDGGLVETRRAGQTVYYSCRHAGVVRMLDMLQEIADQPSPRADSINFESYLAALK